VRCASDWVQNFNLPFGGRFAGQADRIARQPLQLELGTSVLADDDGPPNRTGFRPVLRDVLQHGHELVGGDARPLVVQHLGLIGADQRRDINPSRGDHVPSNLDVPWPILEVELPVLEAVGRDDAPEVQLAGERGGTVEDYLEPVQDPTRGSELR
jgi:hypothetical protein